MLRLKSKSFIGNIPALIGSQAGDTFIIMLKCPKVNRIWREKGIGSCTFNKGVL